MSIAKVQVDEIEGLQRISIGEFNEVFPKSTPLVNALSFLADALSVWHSGRSVLVGQWHDEPRTSGWRVVTAFPYPCSPLKTSTIELRVIPNRNEFADAIECGWRLPRLLLCVVDRHAEHEVARLSVNEWRRILADEIPSTLLSFGPRMLSLGFYHQRWVSTYVPVSAPCGLAEDLVSAFHGALVSVGGEL